MGQLPRRAKKGGIGRDVRSREQDLHELLDVLGCAREMVDGEERRRLRIVCLDVSPEAL
jgi:hypothetical protein